jgi:hypothetical protein
MTKQFVIGCDPGGSGAVAVVDQHGNARAWRFDKDRKALITDLPKFLCDSFVIIEDVHAIGGSRAKSTFAFGRNLGKLEGIIEAMGGTVDGRVLPSEWQAVVTKRIFRPFTKGLDEADKAKLLDEHRKKLKLESIRAAEAVYPGITKDNDGVADACNIARYGLLVLQGKIVMAVAKKKVVKKKVAPKAKKPASKKPAAKKAMATGY